MAGAFGKEPLKKTGLSSGGGILSAEREPGDGRLITVKINTLRALLF